MLDGGTELFRPLIVLWTLPALAAVVLLMATSRAAPRTQTAVMTMVRALALAYVAGAVVLILWPLEFNLSFARVEDGNWTPFDGTIGFMLSDNPRRMAIGRRDVLANVVMFAPIGLLVPYAFYQWRGIAISIFVVVVLAFALEVTQGLLVEQRTFDIDDAIAGAVGGTAGALAAGLISPLARGRR